MEKDKPKLSQRTAALKAVLDGTTGATSSPISAPKAATPMALIYKVMGKMFAILSIKGDEYVILKCDPHLAEMLREKYSGVGHRSHLDRRFWISVNLNEDVPASEIKRLIAHSYEQVCAKLTAKQRAALGALSRDTELTVIPVNSGNPARERPRAQVTLSTDK
jgi:predicted DNA-binding protein (MmcQ/YjbR family)